MFSFAATLHSYTGCFWGRVRSSDHNPPDPSRKLPTAFTHFLPGFLYGSLKNWEVLGGLDKLGTHPHYPRRCCCCTFREDKNGPLLQRKKKTEENREKKKKTGPSFCNSTAEELELGSSSHGFNPGFYFWFWSTS